MAEQKVTGDALASSRLEHLPVAFFSSVMGLCGLTIASLKVAPHLAIPETVPLVLAFLSAAVLVIIAVLYAAKAAGHWHAVVEEFNHPVKLHFFPTFSISLILLSIVALHYSADLARTLSAIWYGRICVPE